MTSSITLRSDPAFELNSSKKNADGILRFSRITLNEDYRKKWRITLDDFICLTIGGELLRPTLYRVGGLGVADPQKNKYFCLIKHVEACYSQEFMESLGSRGTKDPHHLESKWCILDQNGNEKVEFGPFESPYLINDSCIYSVNNMYYNIETGELYGRTYGSFSSSEFLFLHLPYEKDTTKRGVMKINKSDGTWEMFH